MNLSIVVPIGKGDDLLRPLLKDLSRIDDEWEIILVHSRRLSLALQADITRLSPRARLLHVIECSRAHQLNAGAQIAAGGILWFLHADSRIDAHLLDGLNNRLSSPFEVLGYFDLQFYPPASMLMKINAFGANIRSQYLGIPFGDQGFLLRKLDWLKLGGFPVEASYGEDHLFVWKARRAGLRLERLPYALATSARKYKQKGWSRTTLNHLVLTWKQAAPEIILWIEQRYRSRNAKVN